ncbi:PAAR domain-containing protein [Paraburkholderia sp. A1RO-5]|uniref:PAAR domain-containing protein n=1 Tax=Paraburkholderia sp. A1RO-5 TaxID=3028369 RepID=UPI003B9DCFA2
MRAWAISQTTAAKSFRPRRTSHHGVPVALDGHLVRCAKCGGDFPIVAKGRRTHGGVRVAFIGDTTTCGATLQRGT